MAMFVPATRSDILLLLRKSSAVTTTGERDVEGRGGEWDKANLNGHFHFESTVTVLYSTVPKYLSSTSSAIVCKVADLMLVYLARQVVMISTSKVTKCEDEGSG